MNNQIDVPNGTCISLYMVEEVCISNNKLNGSSGILCNSDVFDVICTGNYIEGEANDTGTGFRATSGMDNYIISNNIVKTFAIGIHNFNGVITRTVGNIVYDCGTAEFYEGDTDNIHIANYEDEDVYLGGDLDVGGDVDITGTVNTTSDDDWDLNDYTAVDVNDTGYITVTINETEYKVLTRLEP